MNQRPNYCDGLSRRDALKVGWAGASAWGLGMSLPGLLQRQALAEANGSTSGPARSLIFLFLSGGMSTIDTFDLKPDAPAEFRGEFRPADTNVPGMQICEHLPLLARQADKFSLIRSFTHSNSNHGAADHYMLTGYHPTAGFNPNVKPNNQRPAHGSVIARQLGPRGSVPPYVCLPSLHDSGGPSYLGAAHAPFVIEADPNAPNFSVPDMLPPLELAASRVQNRQSLLAQVDRFQQNAEAQANAGARAVSTFRTSAFDLMTSPEAKQAFDLGQEPDAVRDRYGRNTLGQSCLMARRLVEAGVRCVTVDHTNWDTHDTNFGVLRNQLLPMFDPAVSSLFADLSSRGLLDSTMVIISGEFGRTPRINNNAGRDHWGPGFTVLVGGGGFQGGRIAGRSDARAERPAENPYGPEDLAFTLHTLMGINPRIEFHTPEGRPIPLVNQGHLIRELV